MCKTKLRVIFHLLLLIYAVSAFTKFDASVSEFLLQLECLLVKGFGFFQAHSNGSDSHSDLRHFVLQFNFTLH